MISTLRSISIASTRSFGTKKSYVHGITPVPLTYETIGQRLASAVQAEPDKEYLVFTQQNIRKTYSQLYEDARQFAAGLLSLGLHKGDRVAVWGQNHYEWVLCQYATAIAGLVQVNINPSYQTAEMDFALKKVGVKALITPEKSRRNHYMDTMRQVSPQINNGEAGIGILEDSNLPNLKHIIVFGNDQPIQGAWSFNDIWHGAGSDHHHMLESIERTIPADAPVNIQYTSGTTGYPKAATLTHFNLINNAYFVGLRSGFDHLEHRLLMQTPLFHCFGCVLGVLNAMTHTQTCVFPSVAYDPVANIQAVHDEKCSFVLGTPTMYIDLLAQADHKQHDLSSLRGGYISGAPCPLSLCQRLIKDLNLHDMFVLYGCTELSPAVTMALPTESPEQRIKNVGHVLPATEIMVADENGVPVPMGEKGEVMVRGYNVMQGYWNDVEKTKKEITPDGWYHTGDTGSINDSGSINIVGRTKDMIVKGGENIYPTEIEQFLFKQPYIADVQVIGVPDERYGENVCAWIRLKEDCNEHVTEDSIKDVCKGKISHYKIPKYVLIKEQKDFPLTPSGKVKKYQLRDKSLELLGLQNVRSHFNVTA